MSGSELVGRHAETALLGRVLHHARKGSGGSSVLLRGEAGMGKTALLELAGTLARDSGFAVLRTVGAEAEAETAFGALHQLLHPLLERSTALSNPQREALESVLGLRSGPPAGGFLVGAASMALLAEAARVRPMLIVVDDLHWIDSSSAGVLAFLHRRIGELPLAFVTATRPGRWRRT